MAEVAEAARDLMGADNQFDRTERLYAAHNAALMRGLGYADASGALRIRARLRSGRVVERTLMPAAQTEARFLQADTMYEWIFPSEVYGLGIGGDADWVAAFDNTPSARFREADLARPVHLTQRTRYFTRALPEQNAYYLQVNQIDDTTWLTFMHDALAEVDRVRPQRLIIDLRNNFGGDASRAREVVHELIRRTPDRPWGQLYVLTGRRTFSAAVLTLAELMNDVDFTLVGEPPGAPLNSYGDAVARLYPAAGLRLDVSALRHQKSKSNDVRAFIPIDVPVQMSFADYIDGRDPALDRILAGEEMRSIPQIVRADGGAAAREVYQRRLREYETISWWAPPTELEMRQACNSLVAANRLPEALEACALTTEMHPFVWNSWYNLGATQRAAGMMRERLSAYRCVLELEPTTFNGPGLRRAIAEGSIGEPPLPPGCPVGR